MSDEKFIINDGNEAKLVPVESKTPEITPEPTPSPVKAEKKYHCSTCREDIDEVAAMKMPIDYGREEDGSLSTVQTRYSVFCPNCQKFLTIIDSDAAAALQELVKRHSK